MALINCKECGGEVSSTAQACPKCGAPVAARKPSGAGRVVRWVVGVPVGAFALVMLIGAVAGNSPQAKEKQRAREVMAVCMKDMNDSLRSFTFRNAARQTCEGLRDEFVRRFGHEP